MLKLFGKAVTPAINLTISADVAGYNVFSAAGSPSSPVQVVLTINSGIYVGNGGGGAPAIETSGFAAGSTLKIINNGFIEGHPGTGGFGAGTGSNGNVGGDGGVAIDLWLPLAMDNTNGYVRGGGGGGGSGGGGVSNGGADGGSGEGYQTARGAGDPAVGDGGAGGDGGLFGDYGDNGFGGTGTSGGAGGAPGKAIALHGGAGVTWLGGNNSSQVKGAVA
jgi:hypothetical protein